MNRIDAAFARLSASHRFGLFPYLTVGFPTLEATEPLALTMLEAGADGVELGIPFSDPVADGVTLQRASERALRNGASLRWSLQVARRLRERTDKPLIAMTYFNPIYRYGIERLAADAEAAGIDGLIVPDLPFAEAQSLMEAATAHGMHVIQMLAPTSTDQRLDEVERTARGFVYCVSLLGTTGVRAQLSDRLPGFMRRVRSRVRQPLMVGFGIARPEHIEALKSLADACVIGGAIADLLDTMPPGEGQAALRAYVSELRAACDG